LRYAAAKYRGLDMASAEVIKSTSESLERVQKFDPKSLSRDAELGQLAFKKAVQPAASIINAFSRINLDTIDVFSDGQLNQIKSYADGFFNLLDQILHFDLASAANAAEEQRNLVAQIKGLADNISDQLWQFISYSVASSLDVSASQQQIRAVIQSFADERTKALADVEALKADAEGILARVRDAAAEQGVSQQAGYFKIIADGHDTEAGNWLKYSLMAGGVMVVVAVLLSLIYKWPWLAPKNNIEAAQIITSKLVIVGIFGYAVVTAVKNFSSHKHNAVVNRHRQNALLTYTAFVDAAPSTASREIVLTHAAASVFAPQDTGLIKNEEPVGGRSVMEMVTRAASLHDAKP
jgi:hypothetical protein